MSHFKFYSAPIGKNKDIRQKMNTLGIPRKKY